GRAEAVHFFGHPRIGIGVVAKRPELFLAVETIAAGDRERDDDAIANFQFLVAAAHFHDLAHEFVAEDVALLHGWDVAVVDMQIGPADRGRGDLDDRIARIDDLRIGDAFDADVFFAVITDRFHRCPPRRRRGFE